LPKKYNAHYAKRWNIINGFGQMGRLVFRAIVEQGLLGKDVAVVALNDLVL
jgi:glyceraldehyde-3-phosphate dehydrogenase/erythrose-4-phosphate dehydrogenase